MGGRGVSRRLRVVALAVLTLSVVSGAWASLARADGDPASDYLLSGQVFLAAQSGAPSASQRALESVVAAANRAGLPLRVAVIPSEYDLGSITELWLKPRLYARFLGLELSLTYKQRLLVVMPNGFGFNWPGHSPTSTYKLLGDLRIGPADSDLSRAAQAAVRRIATAAGVSLTTAAAASTATPASHRASGNSGGAEIPGAAAVAAAALIGIAALVVARRRRRLGPATARPARPTATQRPASVPLQWAIPGLAGLLAIAIGLPIALLVGLRHARASAASTNAVVTPPPVSWPAGRRLAPDFALYDQGGRRVSVSAFRGRPVILTFVDPLCRNLCPLEAKTLNYVVGGLPASRRPAIIAVSVDVFADARADLVQDERRWRLVPQWHWAVGRPSDLAAVWKRYQVGVSVVTKRVGRVALHYVTHSEAAYIIDGSGHERALFLWPFYPQDVERTLQQLR